MKVKANWQVDTGKKVHAAGAVFDVADEEAKILIACGAVEAVPARRAAAGSEAQGGAGAGGGDGSDGDKQEGGGADGGGADEPS